MQVLVVEDDLELGEFVSARLGDAGYEVVLCPDHACALAATSARLPDIAIVDILLPRESGLDLLRRWRRDGLGFPVMLLTALDRIEDRVSGLDAGADDYLGKPFAPAELLARVAALGRRAQSGQPATLITEGATTIDLLQRQVIHDGQSILLQPREFRLLEELMRNSGEAVTRQMLLENVWGYSFDPLTNIVETHMSRLRTKLAEAGARDLIETLRGVGYRFRRDG